MRSVLIAVILGLCFECTALATPPAGPSLLERLVSKHEETRWDAEDAWEDLDDEPRFRLLLAGLRSANADVAWFAADRLDPWRLDLEELRLRARLMAGRPEIYFLSERESKGDILVGLGAPEIPVLLRAFAGLRIEDPEWFRGKSGDYASWDQFQQIHREMSEDHLPVLVSLLPAEDPTVFRAMLHLLDAMAMYAAEHRDVIARGFLYGLARIDAEKAEKPPRPLESFRVDAPKSGLPEAFLTIARRAFFREPGVFDPCFMFTLRWARDLTAGEQDVAFLFDVADRCAAPEARAWAVAALAGLDGRDARAHVDAIAAGASELAAFAAAARGDAKRLSALITAPAAGRCASALALARFPEALDSTELPLQLEDGSGLSKLEAEFGIRIPPERAGPILRGRMRRDLEAGTWRCGQIGSLAEHLSDGELSKLLDRPEDSLFGWYANPHDPVVGGIFEIRAPAALRGHLTTIARSEIRDARDSPLPHALRLLARWGDASLLPAMLERLPRQLSSDPFGSNGAAVDVAGVRDERVARALTALARSEDPELSVPALMGLCVAGGVDRRALIPDWFWGPDVTTARWTRFRELVLAGDPVGALVHLHGSAHAEEVAWLGLTRDPRALALLRRYRRDRDAYWPATAGLALAGDVDARVELTSFLRDRRTAMLDDLEGLYLHSMEADPAGIDLIIERIGDNCCAAHYALWALETRYPSLDGDYETWNLLETRRRVRSWYDRNRSRLVWSKIARGYIPR